MWKIIWNTCGALFDVCWVQMDLMVINRDVARKKLEEGKNYSLN